MQDNYDFEKLEMIKYKYWQNHEKGIPLWEIFSPEEHVYILKCIFESLLLEMGTARSLTYDEVLNILEIMSEDQELN